VVQADDMQPQRNPAGIRSGVQRRAVSGCGEGDTGCCSRSGTEVNAALWDNRAAQHVEDLLGPFVHRGPLAGDLGHCPGGPDAREGWR
jgi:hypothetical protein